MRVGSRWLLAGGLLTGAAALLHLAIVTAGIAAVLGVWALYALSGAGVIRRLPFLRVALVLIAGAYLARGVLGIPAVLLVEHAYARELRARMPFMVVSSLVCLGLGVCYAVGALAVRRDAGRGAALTRRRARRGGS
jgi:hypothetical protein